MDMTDDLISIMSNNDNTLSDIQVSENSLIVKVTLWDGQKKVLRFTNYVAFKEKQSIGEEIGDVIVQSQSQLLDEVMIDIVNADGSSKELNNLKSFVFKNSWNNRVILEVLAEDVMILY